MRFCFFSSVHQWIICLGKVRTSGVPVEETQIRHCHWAFQPLLGHIYADVSTSRCLGGVTEEQLNWQQQKQNQKKNRKKGYAAVKMSKQTKDLLVLCQIFKGGHTITVAEGTWRSFVEIIYILCCTTDTSMVEGCNKYPHPNALCKFCYPLHWLFLWIGSWESNWCTFSI